MKGIEHGFFETTNPYNQRVSTVEVSPKNVHTIVFWSKDLGGFLKNRYGEKLLQMGFNLYFNFTVNSPSPLLEPNVPPLDFRLEQMTMVCKRFNAGWVNWRFDPICFYSTKKKASANNLDHFQQIAEHAARNGIARCTTSFMDHYPKINKRLHGHSILAFLDPAPEQKVEILLRMKRTLDRMNIKLYTCCEKDVMHALPADADIHAGSCIPGDLLVELFGGRVSLKKDPGQRRNQGCGCYKSIDIGSYKRHPCFHNCLFCYANPASGHPNGRVV